LPVARIEGSQARTGPLKYELFARVIFSFWNFAASNWEATQAGDLFMTNPTQYISWCGGDRKLYCLPHRPKAQSQAAAGNATSTSRRCGKKNADGSKSEGRCSAVQGKDRKQIGDWKRKVTHLFLSIL